MKGILSIRASLAAGLLAVLAAACSDSGAPLVAPDEPSVPIPGTTSIVGARQVDAYIVTIADRGLTPAGGRRLVTAQMVDAVESTGGSVAREWPQIGRALVRGISEAEAAALARVPGVQSVTRDVVVPWIPTPTHVELLEVDQSQVAVPSTVTDPTDAVFWHIFQWNMKLIQVDDAFAVQTGDPSIEVAILDSGITPEHLDMEGNVDLARSQSVINTGGDPSCPAADQTDFRDFNFHGTHVASIVTSNNIGAASVAPNGTLVAVKVLNCRGSGSFSDVIDGLLYAASLPVDVINMSIGVPGGVPDIPAFQPLIDAVGDAVGVAIDANIAVVNSAGNDGRRLFPRGSTPGGGPNFILVPGQTHRDIVVVSATGPVNQSNFNRLASYSNFGAPINVAAPGGDFISGNSLDFVIGACSPLQVDLPFTCGFGSYVLVVGTSQAAPHAAGVLALIDAATGGNRDERDLRGRLSSSADDHVGTSLTHGDGRINALDAVQ
ncbi:MAG: S8 family serine peptidase [Gemmatimonadota bacterium]